MKKLMILAGAALVALVACNKSETVVKSADNEISFKAMTNVATKADPELLGTNLPDSYTMRVSATSRDVNGTIETPKFFTGKTFAYNASHIWTTTPKVYWPLGGSSLDFLALAFPSTAATVVDAATTWNTTNSADEVVITTFDPIATDLLYAAANSQKVANAENGNASTAKAVPMHFQHAGAVIDIVVKSNLNAAVQVNSVKFGNLTKDANALADRKFTSLAQTGTLTINNERNILSASWDYTQPTNVAYTSLFAFPSLSGVIETGATGIDADNIIVVPQPKLNFVIEYQMGSGSPFVASSDELVVTYNGLKGNWLAGHKYTYTITLNLYEIEVKEDVEAYIVEAEVYTIA